MARFLPSRSFHDASDETLIRATRDGRMEAYAVLWDRHSRAGMRAAWSFRELADPDDLVSEAFTLILGTIQRGAGPESAFRPYLYTVIRNQAMRSASDRSRFTEAELDDLEGDETTDREMSASLDRNLLASAFRSLPDRWQTVLWYTEVDRLSPPQVAVLMGMSANGVSALAYRARRALRAAWLQQHVDDSTADAECRFVRGAFGEFAGGRLRGRDRSRVEAHLEVCVACRIVTEEARDVSGRLALVLIPLFLGAAGSVRFLAAPVESAIAAPTIPTVLEGVRTAGTTPPVAPKSASTSTALTVTAVGVTVAIAGTIAAVALLSGGDPTQPVAAGPGETLPPVVIESVAPVATEGGEPAPESSTPSVIARTVVAPKPTRAPKSTPKPTSKPTSSPRPTGTPTPTETPTPTGTPTPSSTPTASPSPLNTLVPPALDSGLSVLTKDAAVVLTGSGRPGSTVAFFRGGTELGSAVVAADGSWNWVSTGLLEGPNALEIIQRSEGWADSAPVVLELVLDTIAPTVPSFTDTWTGSSANLALAGTGEPSALIELRRLGTVIATATVASDGSWTIPAVAGLDPSTREFTATALDAAGNRSAPGTAGPFAFAPTLAAPLDGAVVTGTSIPFTLGGWPGAEVEIRVNGALLGTLTLDSLGTKSASIVGAGYGVLAPGVYAIRISYADTWPEPAATMPVTEHTVELVS
jgi:RNA polymerase sigma factor (sigma-70 family)